MGASGGGQAQAVTPIRQQRVCLRVGMPTLVPFELFRTAAAVTAADGALTLRAEVRLLGVGVRITRGGSEAAPVGARRGMAQTVVRLVSSTTTTATATTPDWQVGLENARAWYGEANAAIARWLMQRMTMEDDFRGNGGVRDTDDEEQDEEPESAIDRLLAPCLDRFRVLMQALPPPPPATETTADAFVGELYELQAQIQARKAEALLAVQNVAHAREVSARAASDASTVRNAGVSLGNLRIESWRQASLRTASMAFD